MSELTLTLLRLGFLALLWLLVLSILGVLRRDLFGTRIVRRTPRAAGGASLAGGAPATPTAARRPRSPEGRPGLRTLVVTEGSLRGTTLSLGQAPVLIGRAPESTLVLDDDFASARHARIFPQDGGWFVEDLGSTNGTFVGSTRLEHPTRLEAGVPVRVGRTVLELRR
jgi:FHA domain